MGLTQTKLHHRVLQENWSSIRRRLSTEDGWRDRARIENPCGDYPLHLACYGGKAPPEVIRALVAAYPEALNRPNRLGHKPLDLARSNYREGHPYRDEVLGYLEAYVRYNDDGNDNGDNDNDNDLRAVIIYDDDEDGTRELSPSAPEQQVIAARSITRRYVTSAICVVCLENPADHVVVPCGHSCLCGDCARRVVLVRDDGGDASATRRRNNKTRKKMTCPVCRDEFDSIVRMLLPPSSTTTTICDSGVEEELEEELAASMPVNDPVVVVVARAE